MDVGIIGLDCATEYAKVGAALGEWRDGSASLHEVRLCGKTSPVQVVNAWLDRVRKPVLLALDAPLGWPVPFSRALSQHLAGEELAVDADQMFRRTTDRSIHAVVGRTPLDVGADRIARTAHAALKFLGELRRTLASSVPLAWSPQALPGISAIEVYPAATLTAHSIRSASYKKPESIEERKEIIDALGSRLTLPSDVALLEANADALDAVVCLLAAKDFLEARSIPPTDLRLSEKEGWIWCRPIGERGEA